MLKQLEGSQGVAQAVALCRPDVVCAYPISPQTHIVENLGLLCRKGVLQNCEYINVESEFAAMSVAMGASAAGGRAYTATAGRGLLFMVEPVYNAGGLGLPIVMTVANRAIGAPINIWNDHSDSMSQRDSGWLQLFAETNQEAVDLHIQAFRIAEELSLPVMVCMDGFVLTHAFERMDIPEQAEVDAFLPPYEPRQQLDPANPYSIGAMVGPEAFTEVRYLAHRKMCEAVDTVERVAGEFRERFGRESGGLVSCYRMEDAEVAVFAMGSLLGTIKDTVDEMREQGVKIGVVGLKCYRPFPFEAVRKALANVRAVVVIERMVSAGCGGALELDVMRALRGLDVTQHSVIAGLGELCLYTVNEREYAMVFALGELKTVVDEPGIHVKLPPPLQNVVYLDKRILTLDASGADLVQTSEKKNLMIDTFVKWRIGDPRLYWVSFQGSERAASDRLSALLRDVLNIAVNKRTVNQITSSEREKAMSEISELLQARVRDVGIDIVDVRMKRVDFTPEISESVYRRMEAERKRVASEERSKGAAEAERIRANADRQSEVILAQAYRDAQKTKGEGDAEAARLKPIARVLRRRTT